MDVKAALATQYRAALKMLRDAIGKCPDDLWTDPAPKNAFWRVAYHALFFGHLYLMPDEASFVPWEGHREEHQFLGNLPWPPHDPPAIGEPYSREQMLEYCAHLEALIDPVLDTVDLAAGSCGFWWYELPKLDHEMLSIRHLQHHAGQLADRLRNVEDEGVRWRA
jgi:hypothetical protein